MLPLNSGSRKMSRQGEKLASRKGRARFELSDHSIERDFPRSPTPVRTRLPAESGSETVPIKTNLLVFSCLYPPRFREEEPEGESERERCLLGRSLVDFSEVFIHRSDYPSVGAELFRSPISPQVRRILFDDSPCVSTYARGRT